MKKCTKCNIEKDLSEFYNCDRCKDNLTHNCKQCMNSNKKEWRKNNFEKNSNYSIKYHLKNKHRIDRKLKNEQQKKYRILNKDKINLSNSIRYYNNPNVKLMCCLKSSIRNSFKNNGYTKKSKTYEILGCSFEEFKNYLESKFETWMTWDNRGLYNGTFNYGWDIDHIIPSSSANTEEELIKLNHYTNLQPLCSKVNRDIKKDKILVI